MEDSDEVRRVLAVLEVAYCRERQIEGVRQMRNSKAAADSLQNGAASRVLACGVIFGLAMLAQAITDVDDLNTVVGHAEHCDDAADRNFKGP